MPPQRKSKRKNAGKSKLLQKKRAGNIKDSKDVRNNTSYFATFLPILTGTYFLLLTRVISLPLRFMLGRVFLRSYRQWGALTFSRNISPLLFSSTLLPSKKRDDGCLGMKMGLLLQNIAKSECSSMSKQTTKSRSKISSRSHTIKSGSGGLSNLKSKLKRSPIKKKSPKVNSVLVFFPDTEIHLHNISEDVNPILLTTRDSQGAQTC